MEDFNIPFSETEENSENRQKKIRKNMRNLKTTLNKYTWCRMLHPPSRESIFLLNHTWYIWKNRSCNRTQRMATIQTMLSFHDATRLEVNNNLNKVKKKKVFLSWKWKIKSICSKENLKCTKNLEPSGTECTHTKTCMMWLKQYVELTL